MITAFIKGQELTIHQPIIADKTIDYITAKFIFQSSDWKDTQKTAVFSKDEKVYAIILENDAITADKHLNLTAGEWEVFVYGTNTNGQRITTTSQKITVVDNGNIDGEQFPEIPLTLAEQIQQQIGDLFDLDTIAKRNLVEAINEIYRSGGGGGGTGADGIGIESIEQTTTSTESNGVNIITITLTNGKIYEFEVRNGQKGADGKDGKDGKDGYTPIKGTDYWTDEDEIEMRNYVDNKLTDCVKYEDTIYIEVDTADRNEDDGSLHYDDSLVVHIDGLNRQKRYVLLLKYYDETNIEMIPLTQRYDTGTLMLQGVDFGHSNIIYLENGLVNILPIPCMFRPTGYIVADEYNNIDVDKEALLGDIGDITAKEYVDNKIGDIETALDNIITLQNSLIGGDGV